MGWCIAVVRRARQQARGSRDIGKTLTKVKLFAVNPTLYERKADVTDRDARPPLLLFPGLLCDARLWRDQVEALSPTVRCVVADCTQDDTLIAMAERALAAVPGRFAVAGLSMGGYAAMALVRRAPERVDALCLMDTSARPDTPEQARRRRGLMALVARGGRFTGITPRLLPLLLHPARLGDQALSEEVMAMADRVGPAAYLRQQAAIVARPDSRPDLPRIAVPTLVAVGEGDQLTPPDHAAEIASLVPGAALHVVEGAGHLLPMEQPDAATRLMREWLDATLPTTRRPH